MEIYSTLTQTKFLMAGYDVKIISKLAPIQRPKPKFPLGGKTTSSIRSENLDNGNLTHNLDSNSVRWKSYNGQGFLASQTGNHILERQI